MTAAIATHYNYSSFLMSTVDDETAEAMSGLSDYAEQVEHPIYIYNTTLIFVKVNQIRISQWVGLASWFRESGGIPSDPLFSFRHGSSRKCCKRNEFVASTKKVAVAVGLDNSHFSSKSWKVGRVSHEVIARDSESALLAHGNHRSVGAYMHYRPGGLIFGATDVSTGVSGRSCP